MAVICCCKIWTWKESNVKNWINRCATVQTIKIKSTKSIVNESNESINFLQHRLIIRIFQRGWIAKNGKLTRPHIIFQRAIGSETRKIAVNTHIDDQSSASFSFCSIKINWTKSMWIWIFKQKPNEYQMNDVSCPKKNDTPTGPQSTNWCWCLQWMSSSEVAQVLGKRIFMIISSFLFLLYLFFFLHHKNMFAKVSSALCCLLGMCENENEKS